MMHPRAPLSALLGVLVLPLAAQEQPATPDAAESQPSQVVLTDALLGAPVIGDDDATLGTLDDVVVDGESGRLLAAVIAPAPSVRADGQLVPVPVELLDVADAEAGADRAPHRVRLLGVQAERLAQAPAIDPARWPDADDRAWFDRMVGHFGATVPAAPARLERLSALVGRDVQDAQTSRVGRVSNVAVDFGERELALALVEEPGGSDRVLAVPYSALRRAAQAQPARGAPAAAGADAYSLNMSRERLASAPRVGRADLARLRALARSREAHEFFGVPRRAEARPERDQPARPRGDDDARPGRDQPARPQGEGRPREGGGPRTH